MVPPQAAIQRSGDGFVGAPVSFNASGSVAGSSPITSYTWNFGDGTTAGPNTDPAAVTIYNDAGTYQATVVVTDENGLSSSAVTEVVISARPQVPIEWTLAQYGNMAVLPGTSITFKFMAGQIEGFAGCNTYNGSYTATPNPDGTYAVTITGLFTTGMACPAEIMPGAGTTACCKAQPAQLPEHDVRVLPCRDGDRMASHIRMAVYSTNGTAPHTSMH
jgi:heat shock protein HslJ